MTTITITKLKVHLLANRDRAGETIPQYIVGAVCGINPNTISEYARGIRSMKQKHLHALCAYFDVEPDELTGTVDLPIPDPVTADG